MNKSIKGLVCLVVAGFVIVQTPLAHANADVVGGEVSLGGISEALSSYYEAVKLSRGKTDTTELYSKEYEAPENIAYANVSELLNVRKKPDASSSKVGILYKNAFCLVESVENGWAKITSGDVSGYVKASYLVTGEKAAELAKEEATLYAVVNSSVSALNVRKAPSTSATKVARVTAGEKLLVSREVVINKNEEVSKVWVEVALNDEENDEVLAYVASEYVTFSYELPWAVKYTPYGVGVSDLRVAICDYAKKFIGTKYVWGGESLTKGIDCSSFVQQIYSHFGYTTERNSRMIAKQYEKISVSELQPGDLVFYGKVKLNYINHVAIYIGNGQIIHSSTNFNGVAISSMYFSSNQNVYSILRCCRILDEDQ